MYLEFYGLETLPFRITPDTRVFFAGENRGAILEGLCYAVSHGEGIVKVVGEVGSGKTMLCRMLPHKLTQHIDWVYLAHPSLSPEQTLHAIAYELGLSVSDDTNKLAVMRVLHNELLERYRNNRRVVVLVEEAQGMPLETLEEIRLLSNLETDESKLLQIVLFGQPELDEKLSAWEIRQLNERITHSLYVPPLEIDDIYGYLNFRLRSAGYKGPDIFTVKIAKIIHKYSKGLTRRINILADKALMLAYSQGRHNLKAGDIHDAAFDSQFGQVERPGFKRNFLSNDRMKGFGFRRNYGLAAGLVFLISFGLVLSSESISQDFDQVNKILHDDFFFKNITELGANELRGKQLW